MNRLLLSASLAICLASLPARADEALTAKELETMLDRLESLKDEAGQRKTGRVASAAAAYKAALASNEATIDLYLQCIEKVRYVDQNRPLNDFREWKRSQKDRLGELAFREALRYQLRWLLLGLEITTKELAPGDMAEKAAEITGSIARDVKQLAPHFGIIRENAFGTVFAQAYRIGHLAPEKWPESPLPIGNVYEQVILPRLRQGKDVKKLEAAWTARLEQETLLVNMEAEADRERGEARLDRFNTEERPVLVWKMLTDIYKAGGQRQSAGKMLVFLEANLGHKSAIEWAAEMKSLLQGIEDPLVPTPGESTGAPAADLAETTPPVDPDAPPSISPTPMPPPKESPAPAPPTAPEPAPAPAPSQPVAPAPPAPAPESGFDPFDAVNQGG